MPEQNELNPFINPLGAQSKVTPTTPAAVAPSREGNLYDSGQTIKNNAENMRQNYTLGAAVESAMHRNPNLAVGIPSMTLQEANKEFGLTLTGNPTERVSRSWAENQVKKKEAQQYYEQVSANNPNSNFLTESIGWVGATLTDPITVLLLIVTFIIICTTNAKRSRLH